MDSLRSVALVVFFIHLDYTPGIRFLVNQWCIFVTCFCTSVVKFRQLPFEPNFLMLYNLLYIWSILDFALAGIFLAGKISDPAIQQEGKMPRRFILSFIAVSVSALFSINALADSFSISWGSERPAERQPAEVQESGNGPPAHAPAHGYRARHQYRYFPTASVYHDAGRGVYFYLSGSNWQVAASLPMELRARLGDSVSIEVDTDRPYIYHDQHQRQYPPGKMKKAKKHKGGKKGKK